MCVSENGIKWYKVVYGRPVVAILMDQPLHSGGTFLLDRPRYDDYDVQIRVMPGGPARDTTEFHIKDIFFCDRNSLVVV